MEEEEEAEMGLSPEVLERLVRRPEDLPTHVEENITRYKKNMLRILEVCSQEFIFEQLHPVY